MSKLNVVYTPKIDDEEKRIFEEVFGKDKIAFEEYKIKGTTWGAFDVQIIVDTLNDPAITALLHGTKFAGLIVILVKKLFGRNTKKIMDHNSRPRYTTLIIRKETNSVVVSNVNSNNKILIFKITTDFEEIKKRIEKDDVEYSDEKFKDYLE
jgi:tRNA(Met) C34 N-acetyltransferase TmcA